jgi:hypothetical protein
MPGTIWIHCRSEEDEVVYTCSVQMGIPQDVREEVTHETLVKTSGRI